MGRVLKCLTSKNYYLFKYRLCLINTDVDRELANSKSKE